MIQIAISTVLAMALQSTMTPDAGSPPASHRCYGCNLVDSGQLESELIGRTVYPGDPADSRSMIVQEVDLENRRLYVVDTRTREEYWASAFNLFDRESRNERVNTNRLWLLMPPIQHDALQYYARPPDQSADAQCQRSCEQTTFHYDAGQQAAAEQRCKARC